MAECIAVLTGDIVRSSALSADELDRAMAALAAGADAACGWTGAPSLFTRFRGDGWQEVAPSPRLALRAALFLRAALRRAGRGLDTRIAIGIAQGERPSGDLAAAGGPAFQLSGHALDRMPRRSRMAIACADPPDDIAKVQAILALCDELARRWTPAQCGSLLLMLPPGAPPQADVARQLGITQQMVAKHLGAAGEPAILVALDAVEAGDA